MKEVMIRRGAAAWLLAAVAGGALAASTLEAQTQVHVPDADPTTGPVNAIPLGDRGPTSAFQNVRTQIRVPRTFLPGGGSTIRELAFAAGSVGSYTWGTLEIRLAHLAAGGFGAEFARNLAGDQVVLSRRSHSLAFTAADTWVDVGVSAPFAHDGARDLVVDVLIQAAFFSGSLAGSHRSSTLEHVFALDYNAANPPIAGYGPLLGGAKLRLTLGDGSFVVVGTPCNGSNGRGPAIGATGTPARRATLTVLVSSARGQSAALLFLGRNDRSWGAVPLPFDLGPIGAPQCSLYTDILLVVTQATDAGGNAAVPLAIPDDPGLVGRVLCSQWSVLDASANPLGLAFSALGKSTFR